MTDCPECGASDTACESRYHECLVKEFTDAGYGAVHHLTVAAYMLQHSSKLSLQGWLETCRVLWEFLVENKPPAYVRKEIKGIVDSGKRTFKIKPKDGIAKINKSTWTKTILDVRMEKAEQYCRDVAAWAKSVLEDTEHVGDRIG